MWIFNDFVEKKGGNAYAFLKDLCGLSPSDAAREIYHCAGITNPYGHPTQSKKQIPSKEIQERLVKARTVVDEAEKKQALERKQYFAQKSIGFNRLPKHGESHYLTRKRLENITREDVRLIRFGKSKRGIPFIALGLQDVKGDLMAIQQIYDQKVSSRKSSHPTDKKFVWGGEKKGHYLLIGNTDALERSTERTCIILCEGFSTGASIYLALEKQLPVFCAISATNLAPVAENLLNHYSNSELLIAADNDQWKENSFNTGVTSARKVALIHQGMVAIPDFTGIDIQSKPTDYNDLHCLAGLKAVRESITTARKVEDPTLEELVAILNPDDIKPFAHPTSGKLMNQENASFAVKYFIESPEKEEAMPVLTAAYRALIAQHDA